MNQLPRDRLGWMQLVRRVARVTGSADKAEDLLHSAFVRLAEYSSRNVVSNPRGFLVRAAANIAIDERRHERVRSEVARPVCDLIEIHDQQPLQHEVTAARKRLERCKLGLAKLSPRTREIYLMHRLEGMKYREIAEHFGVSVSAVEKHVAKAALFLADWIEGW